MNTIITSLIIIIVLSDELSITVSPLRQTVSEGGDAIFTATGNGIKTREFEFKYEWLKFEGITDLITVGRNAQLVTNNVNIKDQGIYFCGLTNEWKKTKYSVGIQLTVIGKILYNPKSLMHMVENLDEFDE